MATECFHVIPTSALRCFGSIHVQWSCGRTKVYLEAFQAFEGEGCYSPMEFDQQPVAQLRDQGIL